MHTSLPPLATLQGLFHYNPLNGSIVYLVSRGPKPAGAKAGCSIRGIPHIFHQGKQYPAAAVAWLLYHGKEPPKHVGVVNGDLEDIRLSNLQLVDAKPVRRAGYAPGVRSIKSKSLHGITRRKNKWICRATWNGRQHFVGAFDYKTDAMVAKAEFFRRMAGEEEMGGDEEGERQGEESCL